MFNLFKIAVNAFRESLREPVYFLMLLSALVLIGHYPSAAIFVFSEQMKLVVDSSMATGLIFSLVVAVLCASYTIAREMRNGTVLLLLSKPVQRWSFIAGKIAGIVTAASLFAALCNCACIVAVYIATDQFRFDMTLYFSFLGSLAAACVIGMVANFWRGASFPEIASLAAAVLVPAFAVVCIATQPHPALGMRDLVKALLLINFAVLAMSTVAVVAATRFDVVPNLCFCTLMFFLGLVSSYLFQRETDSAALNAVFGFFYAVIPNWQFFWLADAVAVNRHIPAGYIVDAAFYVLFYIVIAAMWAVAIFQNREVAGSSR
ncbi:MAG: ABC transporter permease [Lentisphaeria bacterium]|nr:ABC transporter permease [Lentisphaeria bacterium]